MTTKLCECGCGQPTQLAKRTDARHGHVAGEPVRFIRGHRHLNIGPLYVVDESTGCWNWQRQIGAGGYGNAWDEKSRRTIRAHRWYWEQVRGSIPEGLELDHVCRNRRCVNPDHLEAVTPTENKRRSNTTSLTSDQVKTIRARYDAGERVVSIAKDFQMVTRSNISYICLGQSWRDEA